MWRYLRLTNIPGFKNAKRKFKKAGIFFYALWDGHFKKSFLIMDGKSQVGLEQVLAISGSQDNGEVTSSGLTQQPCRCARLTTCATRLTRLVPLQVCQQHQVLHAPNPYSAVAQMSPALPGPLLHFQPSASV